MAYRFKLKDRSVADGMRRIAGEQIEKALASAEARDRSDAIHDIRKRCKKLRGLVRLVRPVFDGYAQENAGFRRLADSISAARDSKVMQDTCDQLTRDFADRIDRRALDSIRRQFALQRRAEAGTYGEARMRDVRDGLREARERVAMWNLSADGWDAIADGLRKTYQRACAASAQARSCPHSRNFHELRKRIKYHWYHCRLLENLWPDLMAASQRPARRLSDLLGDHHDLGLFIGKLEGDRRAFGDQRDVEVAIGLARERQARLEKAAWPMIDRLLAQQPKPLARQFGALWAVWRQED